MNSPGELPPPRSFGVQEIADEPVMAADVSGRGGFAGRYAANLAAHPSSDVG